MKYDMLKNINNKFLINDSDMEVLKKYGIDVTKSSGINELLYKISEVLNNDDLNDEEYDELDYIANTLQERNYYKNTNK